MVQTPGVKRAAMCVRFIRVIALLLIGLLCAAGCSNKSGREGKVEVVVSERLKQKGVTLEDWRYSDSDKTFGIKLKTSQPVSKHTYPIISGPGLGQIGSPIPAGDKINRGEWIDFGGSVAFGNPFANFPDSGTITIDAR
jgi:hypothetical protein